MITKNPLVNMPLEDLFPMPGQMRYGDKRTAKRGFSLIFFSMDFCRSMGMGQLTPEVWSVVYSIVCLGSKADGEDAEAIGQFASTLDRYIPGTMPQDIREYSVMKKVLLAYEQSAEKERFFQDLHLVLRMFATPKEQIPGLENNQRVLSIYSFVRDAFVVHERVMADAKYPIVFPVARYSIPYVSEICRDFILDDSKNVAEGQPWDKYVVETWNRFIQVTFPCLGSAAQIPLTDNLSSEYSGRDLLLRRIAKGRAEKYHWPEEFDTKVLEMTSSAFYTGELFKDPEAVQLRKIGVPSFDMITYAAARREALNKLQRKSIALVTVTSKVKYDRIIESGSFKSAWELPDGDWDYSCSDNPQDSRAMNDLRLWGEDGLGVVFAIGILPTEDREMIEANVKMLLQAHGGDDPVVVTLNNALLDRASLTVGNSFENFIAFPYRPEVLFWLIEARMFLGSAFKTPAVVEAMDKLARKDSLWASFLMLMSGVKSPYFEFQIHGGVTTKDIVRAGHFAGENGSQIDVSPATYANRKHTDSADA